MTREWWIENQDGAEIVIPEDDCSKRVGVQIWNCVNTTVKIEGKVKGVAIFNCEKSQISVFQCVAPVSIQRSKGLKIRAIDSVNFVELSHTNECELILNEKTRGCKLQTDFCRSTFLKFPKVGATGDELTDEMLYVKRPVMELYETQADGDAILTKPCESLE